MSVEFGSRTLNRETLDRWTGRTANLPAKILDFRGFYSSIILVSRGGGFPGKFESSNLIRGNVSREIGSNGGLLFHSSEC